MAEVPVYMNIIVTDVPDGEERPYIRVGPVTQTELTKSGLTNVLRKLYEPTPGTEEVTRSWSGTPVITTRVPGTVPDIGIIIELNRQDIWTDKERTQP